MAPELRSLLAAEVLAEGISALADVRHESLEHHVAWLDRTGARPVLILDTASPPEDLCWAMMDALRELAGIGDGAEEAEHLRRLYSVS